MGFFNPKPIPIPSVCLNLHIICINLDVKLYVVYWNYSFGVSVCSPAMCVVLTTLIRYAKHNLPLYRSPLLLLLFQEEEKKRRVRVLRGWIADLC